MCLHAVFQHSIQQGHPQPPFLASLLREGDAEGSLMAEDDLGVEFRQLKKTGPQPSPLHAGMVCLSSCFLYKTTHPSWAIRKGTIAIYIFRIHL